MVELKTEIIPSISEDLEEVELLYTTGGNVKWYKYFSLGVT